MPEHTTAGRLAADHHGHWITTSYAAGWLLRVEHAGRNNHRTARLWLNPDHDGTIATATAATYQASEPVTVQTPDEHAATDALFGAQCPRCGYAPAVCRCPIDGQEAML